MSQKQMAEIKEVKDLSTVASLRKISQEALKPIILQIQNQMNKVMDQNNKLKQQSDFIRTIFDKQQKVQKQMKDQKMEIYALKAEIQDLKQQNIQFKYLYQRNDATLKEDLQGIRKEKDKNQQHFKEIRKLIEKYSQNIAVSEKLVQQKIKEIRTKFLDFSTQNLSITEQIKKENKKIQIDSQFLKHRLQNQFKNNEQRYNIFKQYETQRQIIQNKLIALSQQIQKRYKIEDMDLYKNCISKDIDRVVTNVSKMLQESLSVQTRQLLSRLPYFQEKIQQITNLQKLIHNLQAQKQEIKTDLSNYKNLIIQKDMLTQKKIEKQFKNVMDMMNQIEEKIQSVLNLQNRFTQQIQEFGANLTKQITAQSSEKSENLFADLKNSFVDTQKQVKQQQILKIQQQREKLQTRANQIVQISNKMGDILTTYSSKLSLMRSDTDLFIDYAKKELSRLSQYKKDSMEKNANIGKVLGDYLQILMMHSSLLLHQDIKQNQELTFVTEHDGIIYQKIKQKRQHFKQNITYRKKSMQTTQFKKSLMLGLVQLSDSIARNYDFLQWKNQKPSQFFQQTVYNNYNVHENRKDVHEDRKDLHERPLSLSPQFQNQTIQQELDRRFSIEHQSASQQASLSMHLKNNLKKKTILHIEGPIDQSMISTSVKDSNYRTVTPVMQNLESRRNQIRSRQLSRKRNEPTDELFSSKTNKRITKSSMRYE